MLSKKDHQQKPSEHEQIMPNLELKMKDLIENMYDYYKKEDYKQDPVQENIELDEFCSKLVIFGIVPDEKSIQVATKNFTDKPYVDL